MSQKSPEEISMSTTEIPSRSINGAFSFRGEDIHGIAKEFFDWCNNIEEQYKVVLVSNRADYNGYIPIDRTRVDKK